MCVVPEALSYGAAARFLHVLHAYWDPLYDPPFNINQHRLRKHAVAIVFQTKLPFAQIVVNVELQRIGKLAMPTGDNLHPPRAGPT